MLSDCLENGVGRGPNHWGCEEAELHVLPLKCSQLHMLVRVSWLCCSFCGGVAQVPGLSSWQFAKYWILIFAFWQPLFHLVLLCHTGSPCVLLATELRQMLSWVHLLCSSTEFAIHGPGEVFAVPEQKYPIFCRITYKYRNSGKTGLMWTLRWENLPGFTKVGF